MADVLPNGIGGLVADDLITASPLILSDRVWYVDSATGDAGNTGKDRKFPKATVGQAVAAIGVNHDHVIVCMAGHDEEIVATVTLAQRVSIVGEGAIAGIPSVKLSNSGNGDHSFNITAEQVELRNLHFDGIDGPDSRHIDGNAAACHILGCHFDMTDEQTDEAGIVMNQGCDYWRYDSCIFTASSTVTPVVSRPQPAIQTRSAISALEMNGCTFDGGVHGFDDGSQNPYAFDASVAAVSAIRVLRMTLLRGADFKLHVDSSGYVEVPCGVSTGHAKVEW